MGPRRAILQAGIVSVAAMLAGMAVAGLAELWVVSAQRAESGSAPAAPGGSIRPAETWVVDDRVAAQRNIFASAAGGRSPTTGGELVTPRETLQHAELLATFVAGSETRWSHAAVQLQDSGRTRMLGSGSHVQGAVVTRITPLAMEFERRGRPGRLTFAHHTSGAAVPRTPDPLSPRHTGEIRRLGPNRYAIDRPLWRKLLSGFGSGGSHGVARPVRKDGRWAGMRLDRVRSGGLFDRLGLRSRDVVTAINNRQLTSVDVLLSLYGTLPGARHATLTVQRGQTLLAIDYTIP